MDEKEHMLACGAEEAAEVAQAAFSLSKAFSKSLRFGLYHENPELRIPAIESLQLELNDLQAVVELLQERGVQLPKLGDRTLIDQKKAKVKRFMQFAREQGALLDNPVS